MRAKDAVGRLGEDDVAAHLVAAGWTVLARNWRFSREGELDIVAAEGATLVVVEVKTRRTAAFGRPIEAVRPDKAARIRRLAMRWLAQDERYWPTVRFDVVGVLRAGDAPPELEHIRAAF